MPEIIIQPNGDMLIPRGYSTDNQFFIALLKEIADEDTQDSLLNFFNISEQSDIIFGTPGLCG